MVCYFLNLFCLRAKVKTKQQFRAENRARESNKLFTEAKNPSEGCLPSRRTDFDIELLHYSEEIIAPTGQQHEKPSEIHFHFDDVRVHKPTQASEPKNRFSWKSLPFMPSFLCIAHGKSARSYVTADRNGEEKKKQQ